MPRRVLVATIAASVIGLVGPGTAQAALRLTQTADQSQVSAGDQIGYTLTVSSTTQRPVLGAILLDVLPANPGTQWAIDPSSRACTIVQGLLGCFFGVVPGGGGTSVHIVSPTTTETCGTVGSSAFAVSLTAGAARASRVPIAVGCPRLALSKVADKATVGVGDQLGWVVTVTNVGDGTARDVSLDDVLPVPLTFTPGIDPAGTDPSCGFAFSSPLVTCSFGDLAPGESRHLHLVGRTKTCGTSINSADARATGVAIVVTPGVPIVVECGRLTLTKVADKATVAGGDPIGWTVTVTNVGLGTAHGVSVDDLLPVPVTFTPGIDPAGTDPSCGFAVSSPLVTCSFGDLAPGESRHLHLIGKTTTKSCGTLLNSADTHSTDAGSATVAGVPIVVECGRLELTKVADTATVAAGGTIGWTVTVTNVGPATTHDVFVEDFLAVPLAYTPAIDPTGTDPSCGFDPFSPLVTCNFGALAPGESRHLHLVGKTTRTSCGTIVNSADAHSTDAGTAVTGVVSIVVTCPTLTISPSVGPPGTLFQLAGAGFAPQSPVAITLDDVNVGTAVTGDDGSWSFTLDSSNLGEGTFVVRVRMPDGTILEAILVVRR